MSENYRVGDPIDVRRCPRGARLTADEVRELPWERDTVAGICTRGCCVIDTRSILHGRETLGHWWRPAWPDPSFSTPCRSPRLAETPMEEWGISDQEITARALNMYANWLETRNVLTSAGDVLDAKRADSSSSAPPLPRKLTAEQVYLVSRLRHLAADAAARRTG